MELPGGWSNCACSSSGQQDFPDAPDAKRQRTDVCGVDMAPSIETMNFANDMLRQGIATDWNQWCNATGVSTCPVISQGTGTFHALVGGLPDQTGFGGLPDQTGFGELPAFNLTDPSALASATAGFTQFAGSGSSFSQGIFGWPFGTSAGLVVPPPVKPVPTAVQELQMAAMSAQKGDHDLHSNLFVGNINLSMTQTQLAETFSAFGKVISVRILIDGNTGNSRGAGFVRFASNEDARLAKERLNGRNGLLVKFADHDVGRGKWQKGRTNLYVAGLVAAEAQEENVSMMFVSIGLNPIRCKILNDTRGTGRCAALVQLESEEHAAYGIKLLNGRGKIQCTFAAERRDDISNDFPVLSVKYTGIEQVESGTLYVGGLPVPLVDVESLKKAFDSKGVQILRTKMLPDTRGKGVSAALVQVASVEQATKAISLLNGQVVQTLGIVADHGAVNCGVWQDIPTHGNVFIQNIPPEVSQGELRKVFLYFGTVMECEVSCDPTGSGPGNGFIRFYEPHDAARAVAAMNGQVGLSVTFADLDDNSRAEASSRLLPKKLREKQEVNTQKRASAGQASKPLTLEYAPNLQDCENEVDEKRPSDRVVVGGLPSPEGELVSLLSMFLSLGLTVGQIQLIPDFRWLGYSGALVKFASAEQAGQAMELVNGKMPSELGVALSPPPAEKQTLGEALSIYGWVATKSFAVDFKRHKTNTKDHIYLTGLRPEVSRQDLEKMFKGLGLSALWIKIYNQKWAWTAKAMIQLGSEDEALYAICALKFGTSDAGTTESWP